MSELKIVISNSKTGEVYDELTDVTSSQVAAYTGSNVLIMDEEEYIVDSVAMEHNNKILSVMVSVATADESNSTVDA